MPLTANGLLSIESTSVGTEAYESLSRHYFDGRGLPKSVDLGLANLKIAADAGLDTAELAYAAHLHDGDPGHPPDVEQSLSFYRAAAEQGNIGAYVLVGTRGAVDG